MRAYIVANKKLLRTILDYNCVIASDFMESPMQVFYDQNAYTALHLSYFGETEPADFFIENMEGPCGLCFAFSTPSDAKQFSMRVPRSVVVSYEVNDDHALINRDSYLKMCMWDYDPETEMTKELRSRGLKRADANLNDIYEDMLYKNLGYTKSYYNTLVVVKSLKASQLKGFFIVGKDGDLEDVPKQYIVGLFEKSKKQDAKPIVKNHGITKIEK